MIRYTSPLRYPGGKSKAAKFLLSKFPSEFTEYREPFFGGGSVYFALRSQDENNGIKRDYWINDKFPAIYWFWRACQLYNARLALALFSILEKAEDLKETTTKFKVYLEDMLSVYDCTAYGMVEAAAYTFFLNRNTFSGTILKGGFGTGRWNEAAIRRIMPMERALAGTGITCQDFEDVMTQPAQHEGPVFMFLDPPYYTTKGLYTLHDMEHERLAEIVKSSPHKIMLTYDNCDKIRELYKGLNIEEFNIQYGMDNVNGKPPSNKSELLIRNY